MSSTTSEAKVAAKIGVKAFAGSFTAFAAYGSLLASGILPMWTIGVVFYSAILSIVITVPVALFAGGAL